MNYIIKELRRHFGMTIASISGYIIATIFILLILSVNGTDSENSTRILKGTGTHFIVYIPSNISCCVSCDNEGNKGSLIAEGVNTIMLTRDVIDSIKMINGVKDASPYLLYKHYEPKFNADISLGGIELNSIATTNNVCAANNIISGKFLSDNNDDVVAEESFAVAHNLSVGDTLKIYGSNIIISGIVNSGIKPGKADLYSPIDNVRKILKDNLKCLSPGFDMNIVLVEVADSRKQNGVLLKLKEKMKYLSVSSYNCYQPASEVMAIKGKTSTLLSVLIFIFLMIFSAKTQLTSLIERYREIGILKSLGWSNYKLGRQILNISMIQALIGVTIGVLSGFVIILIMNSYEVRIFGVMDLQFQFTSIPLLFGLSIAGGLLAVIFPIIKLYRTKAGEMINSFL